MYISNRNVRDLSLNSGPTWQVPKSHRPIVDSREFKNTIVGWPVVTIYWHHVSWHLVQTIMAIDKEKRWWHRCFLRVAGQGKVVLRNLRTLPYCWLLLVVLAAQWPVSTLACSSIPVRLSSRDHSSTLCRWKGVALLPPAVDGITSICRLLHSADGIPTAVMSSSQNDNCLKRKLITCQTGISAQVSH